MDEPIEIVDTEPEVCSLPLEELRRLLALALDAHNATLRSVEHATAEDYQAAAEAADEAGLAVAIYRTEIQIREDARLERQMAQRDRELDILAGNLALDIRKQDHLEREAGEISEQLTALRESMDAVHADHGDDYPPISTSRGRA